MQSDSFKSFKMLCYDSGLYFQVVNQGWCGPAFHETYTVTDKDANYVFLLQKILKAYISEELFPWQQRFPHELYKEIFRLRGWDYTASNIKQRPSVIGHWTNRLIYQKLPQGILKEIKKQTPKNEKGRRKHHYHRLPTEDIGHPQLQRQLVSVITLMNISKVWKEFIKPFNKKFGQQEISFDESEEVKEIPEYKKELSDFNQKLKKAINYKETKG